MKPITKRISKISTMAVLVLLIFAESSQAAIDGIDGITVDSVTTFNLTTKTGYIITPDGGSYLGWGYSDNNGLDVMQYPGPTLIIHQGQTVVINLDNELDVSVSMVFPGQIGVVATGGNTDGLLTREIDPNGTTVTYTFDANEPGTYMYHSGTRLELQIEMGLVGAIIIRPTGFDPNTNKIAYNDPNSDYTRENLQLFMEIDPRIHELVAAGKTDQIDNTTYRPVNWTLNGRCATDTLLPAFLDLLPNQPYNCLPMMHPGEKMLVRMIGAGRDAHPQHLHGNNFTLIARDGRLMESTPGGGVGADIAVSDYTQTVAPGATYDMTFEWTGYKLGWDMYGHDVNDPCEPGEYMPDHGKPFPDISLPEQKSMTTGMFYSGSPFLSQSGVLPPGGAGADSLFGGYFHIWHSHHEIEIVNNDVFPGGILTFLIIAPYGVDLP